MCAHQCPVVPFVCLGDIICNGQVACLRWQVIVVTIDTNICVFLCTAGVHCSICSINTKPQVSSTQQNFTTILHTSHCFSLLEYSIVGLVYQAPGITLRPYQTSKGNGQGHDHSIVHKLRDDVHGTPPTHEKLKEHLGLGWQTMSFFLTTLRDITFW